MMHRLTVLAAGAVEASGTVTELGGSLTTVAAVEANPVAAHSCKGRVWMSIVVEKDKRGEKKNSITNCDRDTWTLSSNVNTSKLEPYCQSVHSWAKRNSEAPPFTRATLFAQSKQSQSLKE